MHATLSLATQIRNGATLLRRNLATPPLKLLSLPAVGDTLHAVQMSSSPGLLAGDTIDTEIELADATSLALYTQAFTRVLSMHEGGEAVLNTRIRLHPGSRLLFLPHPLVLHQGSTLRQTTEIALADNTQLLYGEILAAGRVCNGEAFAFSRLSSRLNIRHQSRLLLSDTVQWQPDRHPLNVVGQMEGHTHQLNLFDVRPNRTAAENRAACDRLYHALAEIYPDNGNLLWGVSEAADGALCLRALAGNAQSLQQMLQHALRLLAPDQMPPSNVFFR